MPLFITNAMRFITTNFRALLILALISIVSYFSVVATSTVLGYKKQILTLEKQLASSNGDINVLNVRISNLEIAKANLEQSVETEIRDRQVTEKALSDYKKKSDQRKSRLQEQMTRITTPAKAGGEDGVVIDAVHESYCIVSSDPECDKKEAEK